MPPPGDPGAQGSVPLQEVDFAVIGDGFKMILDNWKVFVIPGLIIMLINMPSMAIGYLPLLNIDTPFSQFDQITMFFVQMGFGLAVGIISSLFYAGIVKHAWNLKTGGDASMNDLWEGFKDPFGYIGLAFLTGLMTALGVFACCVGTLFVGGLLLFALPIRVITGKSVMNSISDSIQFLKKDWFMIGILYLVLNIISVLGALACLVGQAVTMPLWYVAATLLYCRYVGAGRVESKGPTSYPRNN